MPGDEHRHDHGLAAASRHLESDAKKLWVGVFIKATDVVFNPGITVFVRHLCQIDSCFQGFDLAEKQLLFALWIRPIVEEKTGGFSDADMSAVAPLGYPLPNAVDEFIFFDKSNAFLNNTIALLNCFFDFNSLPSFIIALI